MAWKSGGGVHRNGFHPSRIHHYVPMRVLRTKANRCNRSTNDIHPGISCERDAGVCLREVLRLDVQCQIDSDSVKNKTALFTRCLDLTHRFAMVISMKFDDDVRPPFIDAVNDCSKFIKSSVLGFWFVCQKVKSGAGKIDGVFLRPTRRKILFNIINTLVLILSHLIFRKTIFKSISGTPDMILSLIIWQKIRVSSFKMDTKTSENLRLTAD